MPPEPWPVSICFFIEQTNTDMKWLFSPREEGEGGSDARVMLEKPALQQQTVVSFMLTVGKGKETQKRTSVILHNVRN